jgi:hypothetical protein
LPKNPSKAGNEKQARSVEVVGKVAQVQVNLSELRTALERVRNSQDKGGPLRIQFAEKLLLLDGGTITVTFTAIGIIGSRVSVAQVNYTFLLFGAWWLLLCSMALCIVNLWLDAIIPVVRSKTLAMTDLNKSLRTLESSLQSLESDGFQNVSFPHIPDQTDNLNLVQKVEKPLIVRLGVALLLTLAAFIFFLLFVQLNAHAVFSGVK